jgi:hypothetical protein
MQTNTEPIKKTPWNKGKLIGQKAPLKLRDIWAIRIRLQTPLAGQIPPPLATSNSPTSLSD